MENITLKQIGDLLDMRFEAFEKKIIAQVNEMMDSKFESFGRMMNLRFEENSRDHDRTFQEIHRITVKLEDHQEKIMDIQSVLISSNSHKLKYKV